MLNKQKLLFSDANSMLRELIVILNLAVILCKLLE